MKWSRTPGAVFALQALIQKRYGALSQLRQIIRGEHNTNRRWM